MGYKDPTYKWPKGVSGNPRGRPKKGTTLTELWNYYLDSDSKTTQGEIVSNRVAFIIACLNYAMKGDAAFARLVHQYTQGEPLQKLEATIETKDEGTAKEVAKLNEEFRRFMLNRGTAKTAGKK